jgi:NitT/TauT family transport system permease protein
MPRSDLKQVEASTPLGEGRTATGKAVGFVARDFLRGKVAAQLILALVIVVAWDAAVVFFQIPSYLIPRPWAVATLLVQDYQYLLKHSWVTLIEILIGFIGAIVVAIPLAVLIVYSPLIERLILPLLVASQSVPKVAIAPLLIFWAGIGLLPKALVALLIAFFPIVVDTVIGLRSVEIEMLHLAKSMGASDAKTFWKVRLPSALPYVFAGLKVGVTLAVVGAIVAEFIQADAGLGYALLQASASMNTAMSFAVILVLSAMGILLFWIVGVIGDRLTYWHASHREGELSMAAG